MILQLITKVKASTGIKNIELYAGEPQKWNGEETQPVFAKLTYLDESTETVEEAEFLKRGIRASGTILSTSFAISIIKSHPEYTQIKRRVLSGEKVYL